MNQAENLKPKMLTVREAAQYVSKTTRTIHNWIAAGKIVPYRIGKRGHLLISQDELLQAMGYSRDREKTE